MQQHRKPVAGGCSFRGGGGSRPAPEGDAAAGSRIVPARFRGGLRQSRAGRRESAWHPGPATAPAGSSNAPIDAPGASRPSASPSARPRCATRATRRLSSAVTRYQATGMEAGGRRRHPGEQGGLARTRRRHHQASRLLAPSSSGPRVVRAAARLLPGAGISRSGRRAGSLVRGQRDWWGDDRRHGPGYRRGAVDRTGAVCGQRDGAHRRGRDVSGREAAGSAARNRITKHAATAGPFGGVTAIRRERQVTARSDP